MKRLFGFAGMVLMSICMAFGQENLILNGDFEEAESNFLFGARFEDWTYNGGEIAIETSDVYDGAKAFRTVNVTQKTASLSQEVDLQTDVTGQAFELVIHYKVLEAAEGDLALNSSWIYSRPTEGVHDSAVLNQALPIGEGWQELKVSTTKPLNASYLNVSVQVKKGVKVLFDGFSLTRQQGTLPWFTVSPENIPAAQANAGEEKLMATLTIRQGNLTKPVSVYITGTNRGMFEVEKSEVSAAEETVKVWYKPTAAGTHKAYLMVDSEEATQDFVSLTLSGTASDPTQAPELSITPTTLPAFEATAGDYKTATIAVHSLNCTEDIDVSILNDQDAAAFTINSTLIPKNMEAQTVITFHPTKAGDYSATIYWSTPGVTRQTLRVTGTAVAGSENPDKDWATEFAWDMQKPRVLLDERFDKAEHNKTLVLDGWQNVVLQGDRPWWGFNDTNAVGNVLEKCAKVTAYIYQEKDSVPWEMWLVTPALDYKNAKAKTFTLRVRGDYLSEGQSAELGVYYIDATDPQDVFFQDLGLELPRTADESGDWVDIHINLDGQDNIADVFFMAFRFTGNSGQTGAATYLLDDVSWGRTDLPRITADSTTIILTTTPNAIEAVAVNVTGHNLTEGITVSKGGSNPGSFEVTPTSLPAEGGVLGVGFQSSDLGVHEAYLRLRSRGAADVYIPMAVLVKETTDIPQTKDESNGNQLQLKDGHLRIVTQEGVYSILGAKME